MFRLKTLKAKSVAFIILIVLVPVIILGALGTLYFHEVVRQNIENDYHEEARTIADMTDNYLDRLVLHIESQAERSMLINALERNNTAALDTEVEKINDASELYYWTIAADASGRVLSSHPYGRVAGSDLSDKPYITEPLRTGKTYISNPEINQVTGRLTVMLGTPLQDYNGTSIGVLAGALDDNYYVDILSRASNLEPLEDIFLVNRTGQVVFSQDKRYAGMDLSAVPAIRKVINGEEGVDTNSNFTSQGGWIVAYSPVKNHNLGAIVALPQETVYGPVNNATNMIAGALILLTILSALLALAVGNYLTRPILHLSNAAKEVSKTGNVLDLGKYMPYDRDDELGGLARAFKEMADNITVAREKILGEKKHADMYIDVMGHDINNLNQAILSHLEIMKHYDKLDPQQKKCIDGAIIATNDSAAIIRNVRAIQAVTTEKPALQETDLDQIIRECIEEAPRPEDKKVTINYTPGTGLIAKAVPSIKLAFGNVMRNSIRYSGPEVHLDIVVKEETRDGKKYYVTTVTDDGNGIPGRDQRDAVHPLPAGQHRATGERPGTVCSQSPCRAVRRLDQPGEPGPRRL